jgi:pimeloyl-ACP methyl ester carboxylesterase
VAAVVAWQAARVRRYVNDGLTFDVDDRGQPDGEPILLLHGFPEDATSWSELTPALVAAGYRTLAPDLRGYSRGARPSERYAYRMSALVGDVRALADAAGADRFHLVGHDWGGALAWACAARWPQRLASLTVLSTPHPAAFVRSLRGRQALHSWYMALFQLPWLPEWLLTVSPRLSVSQLTATGLPASFAERYLSRLREPGAATGAINWYRGMLLQPRRTIGSRTGDHRIHVPTMYVYSTADRFLLLATAEASARYVDAPYRFEVLTGVSHWIPETAPDRLAALLLEQLRAYPVRH